MSINELADDQCGFRVELAKYSKDCRAAREPAWQHPYICGVVLMSDSSKFKFSLWAPFVPKTALVMNNGSQHRSAEEDTVSHFSNESPNLQKEVYRWRMVEDAFGGVLDATDRETLENLLFTTMELNADPSTRTIDALRKFVEEAHHYIDSGRAEWTDSQDPLSEELEDVRLNALLALANHLSWIISIFEHQPNISVSVR